VVDIGQHVEHLAVVRYSGVWAQTVPDLSGQDLEIHSQKSWRRRQRWELVAHRCSRIERTKLAVAVNDVGQAPKVEDLAQGEGAGCGEELVREANIAV
jgi:hypothetical protein